MEREYGGIVEVGVRRRGGDRVEAALDRQLRVVELEPEDPADE